MALFDQIIEQKSQLSGKNLKALEAFITQGFPTKKDEEYKYTSLAEIIKKDYNFSPTTTHTITQDKLATLHFGEEDFDYVVFVNGIYYAELSKLSDNGFDFQLLKDVLHSETYQDIVAKHYNQLTDGTAVATLNYALSNNGFFLHVPKNVIVEKPIHVFYISQGQSSNTFYNTRNLLIAEKGAHIEVIESHHNYDDFVVFTNSVTEIAVDSNAKADWHKLQNDAETSYLVDSTFVKQERDSLATVNTFSFGGKIVRNNLDFIQNGENINSFMNGITIINNNQLVDHHTAVHHNQPNCESYQNYKGIYNGQSHGVFNGKVFVDKIAQKTNAYQQNNNVLLSEGASIDSKPQLEIFADDVKCSHGCTVGQLDKDAMFYLRARGISKNEAQALLLYAFANDAMQNIDIPALKLKISKLLAEKLNVDFVL